MLGAVVALLNAYERPCVAESKLPLSPTYVDRWRRAPSPSVIIVNGTPYEKWRGVELLLATIEDSTKAVDERRMATRSLSRIAADFSGTDHLLRIIRLADDSSLPAVLRAPLLSLLAMSNDPRSLPVFTRLLKSAETDETRAIAAGALARWNIRAGVAELLQQFEDEPPRPRKGTEISAQLSLLNSQKGWGFREQRILENLSTQFPEDEMDARWRAFRNRWNVWFEKNEHRFPDWSLGDPLPDIEASGQSDR